MTNSVNQIRARANPSCLICGTPGERLYDRLRDHLFGAPGEWSLKKCSNRSCGLVWLDPMPLEDDLGNAYHTYYTHQDPSTPVITPLRRLYRQIKAGYIAGKYGYGKELTPLVFRVLGCIFYLHPGRRESLDASVFYLPAKSRGRLLEVGCGNGSTLKQMLDLGWLAEGLDFDASSVTNARAKGLTVHHGDLVSSKFEDNTFDAVVMSHVIEHVPNPLIVLQESYRILKPDGILVVLTPNTASLGHWMYGRNWRGLEPPRHLHIFNTMSLRSMASLGGFAEVSCQSSVRAWKIFLQSRLSSRGDSNHPDAAASKKLRIWAGMMEFVESIAKIFWRNAGEELKLIGKKNAQSR